MPKIIKQGSLPDHEVIETTCGNCKTIFTFTVIEADAVYDQRDGDYFKISCPFCSKFCFVSMNTRKR